MLVDRNLQSLILNLIGKLSSEYGKNDSIANFLSGSQLIEKLSAMDCMIWKREHDECNRNEYSIENIRKKGEVRLVTVRNPIYFKCNRCGDFVRKNASDQKRIQFGS